MKREKLTMKDSIHIVEVGPRDGLQNEKKIINIDTKIRLIEQLAAAGATSIEAGAFVSPKWVPQMAATNKVMAGITRNDGVSYPVLTPNMKGYEAARVANADTVAVFAAASESFSQKNINVSIADSLDRFKPVLEAAHTDNVRVRGYVSCVLGCPYEGAISISSVVNVAKALFEMGCYEISLGDTIGVGTAGAARQMICAVADEVPISAIAGHYHDTYGQALANIYASLDEGVRTFDTSISGLGGCPYAPGASGNVATEDVVYMAERSGFTTGLDLDALIETSVWISKMLDRAPSSKVTIAKSAVY